MYRYSFKIGIGTRYVTYDFKFERQIFLHGIDNPPHTDLTCSITLEQVNSSGAFNLIKFGMGHQTEYILEVDNPLQIGFTSSDQSRLDRDLRNFALAMNLALDRNCVTLSQVVFIQNKPTLKPLKREPEKIKQDGNRITVEIHERIVFSDHVSISYGTKENIDETKVIEIFKRLQNANRFEIAKTTPVTANNVAKALKEYEDAMNSFDRLAIFKHLVNAIEIAVNYDGSKDDSDKLDKKISALTGVSQTDAKFWRELYNRAKHPDARTEDIEKYLAGSQSLGTTNVAVRACARSTLLARLP